MPSVTELLRELLGEAAAGSGAAAPARPSLAEAVAACPLGAVRAARDPSRGDAPVAVLRLASGEALALDDRCPHDGGLLSDGFLDGDRLVCARHHWEFDPRSGRCLHRPGVAVTVVALAGAPLGPPGHGDGGGGTDP